jgi:cytochrome c oxidase subunit 2
MISQDVIHSFFVPAFRVKQDVLPGQYTTLWFEATRTGEYHLECSQYCGTDHALMGGTVIVMEPDQYAAWLSGRANAQVSPTPGDTLISTGADLFQTYGCSSCHLSTGGGIGPSLTRLYSSAVQLDSGDRITADDSYLRESILYPNRKVVAGYKPIMPTFDKQLNESDILALLAYIKSLAQEANQ